MGPSAMTQPATASTAAAEGRGAAPLPVTSAPPSSVPPSHADVRFCFHRLKPVCVQLMEQQTQRRLALAAAQRPDKAEDDLKAEPPGSSSRTPHTPPSPLPPFSPSASSILSTLESLYSVLLSLPPVPLLCSLDYVLFPLTSFLTQPLTSERAVEACAVSALSSLTFLFRTSTQSTDCTAAAASVVGDERGLAGLSTLLLSLVRDADSEELKAAAVDAFDALLRSVRAHLEWRPQSPLQFFVLSSPFHITLGYGISLLVPTLSSTSRLLQLRALQCLSTVCSLLSPFSVGVSMLTSYAPGVLSALQRLLVKDDRAGTQVKSEAMRLMTDLIVAVMGGAEVAHLALATADRIPSSRVTELGEGADGEKIDSLTAEVRSKLTQLRTLLPSPSSATALNTPGPSPVEAAGPAADLLLSRDAAWYSETRERLLLILRLVFAQSPLYPRSAALECEYVRSARLLLEQCSPVLRDGVVVLVEYALAMSQHLHDEVRMEATTALSSFITALSSLSDASSTSRALIASLTSRLLLHLRSLPRLLQTSIHSTQLRLLHTTSGYMQLLGSITSPTPPHSPLFAALSSPSTFPHLFLQLLPALRLHPPSSFILERTDDTTDSLVLLHSLTSHLPLLHTPDDTARYALLHLLRGIGQYTGDEGGQLLDALLSFLPSDGEEGGKGQVEEWLVLISQVIVGLTAVSTPRPAVTPYLILALDTFIQPSLFSSSQPASILTLTLAGIATIAYHLRTGFTPFLMHLLFPLLTHLGSTSPAVSSAAMSCLRVVAAAVGAESVSAVVLANVDYVVDSIAAHLLSSHPTPQLLQVMRAVLSRLPPSPQLIPLLRDSLQSTIRLLSLSTADEAERVVCVEMLLGVVQSVRRLYEVEQPPLHPSARSGLFDSAPPIDSSRLLEGGEAYHSPRRVRERVRQRKERFRREDEEAEVEDSERRVRETKVSPAQWYAQLEAKRERREQRKAMGVQEEDTDSDDDDDAREAKRKQRQWREQERKDEAVQPTAEQAVVMEVVKQARSWLGRGGVREQVLVLDLIREAVLVLRTIPKELFPLIAQTWPAVLALIRRYQRVGLSSSSSSSIVLSLSSPPTCPPPVGALLSSLELLCVLCQVASRFLASRFHSELWPLLSSVLSSYQHQLTALTLLSAPPTSTSASPPPSPSSSTSALPLTAAHRLIVSALSSLAFLLRYPDLLRVHLLDVAKAVRPFLSDSAPVQLQEEASTAFRAMFALNAELVEWTLTGLMGEEEEGEEEEEAELVDWGKVEEWRLDRRGELGLIWQRLKEERTLRWQRQAQVLQGMESDADGAPLTHRKARLLLRELRALPMRPPEMAEG